MKIWCAVFGCLLGVFVTNALWMFNELPTRVPFLIVSGMALVGAVAAIKYDWD